MHNTNTKDNKYRYLINSKDQQRTKDGSEKENNSKVILKLSQLPSEYLFAALHFGGKLQGKKWDFCLRNISHGLVLST